MRNFAKILSISILGITMVQCSVAKSEQENVKTLYVSAEQKDCSAGVRKMKCMLVKEKKTGEWEYFYNPISGFTYQPGYEYELKIRVQKVENPPADASSLKYILLEEVSKKKL